LRPIPPIPHIIATIIPMQASGQRRNNQPPTFPEKKSAAAHDGEDDRQVEVLAVIHRDQPLPCAVRVRGQRDGPAGPSGSRTT